MTPEAAREALTEKTARTMRFANGITGPGGEDSWDAPQLPERTRESWRRRARLVMAEVLSARVEDRCEVCRGRGIWMPNLMPDGKCPECGGSGKRYGPLLITVATMKQVDTSFTWSDPTPVFVESSQADTARLAQGGEGQ